MANGEPAVANAFWYSQIMSRATYPARTAVLCLLIVGVSGAQEPVLEALPGVAPLAPTIDAQRKDFIGAEACRPYHASQFARQSATGHARALRRVMAHS